MASPEFDVKKGGDKGVSGGNLGSLSSLVCGLAMVQW